MSPKPVEFDPGADRATACPLCESVPVVAASLPVGRYFHHCRICDLIFVPAERHPDEAAQRKRYAAHQNSPANEGYVSMLRRPIALLQQHGRSGCRVLDYGCGPSPVLVELLRREGYEAAGYDPLFFPDVDLSLPFDAVVSVETFEHFASPRREIERIRGLLRPGGLLAVMTQFHPGPEEMSDWWYGRDETHVAFYSQATFRWITDAFDLPILSSDGKGLVLMRVAG